MIKKVAILGCGPAGLIAAHTARRLGHDVVIASRKEKSIINGAQVLHEPIVDCTPDNEDWFVHYEKHGTRGGYANKIYGDPEAPCSWDLYPEGPMRAWPMRETYDKLWAEWHQLIEPYEFTYDNVEKIVNANDFTFSTVPLTQIIKDPDWDVFRQQEVWIISDDLSAYPTHKDTITYRGDSVFPWYRRSYIKGWHSWEYPEEPPMKFIPAPVRITKPLDVVGGDLTRADMVPAGVTLLGRYGEWRKGRLAHHAQEVVENALL